MTSPEEYAHRLAAASLASGSPTGWFEQLYADADAGKTNVPWDRGAPSPLLVEWATARPAEPPDDGPPWLLTRADIDTFTGYGVRAVHIEHLPGNPGSWRAEFHR